MAATLALDPARATHLAEYLQTLFAELPDTERVARFQPGPGFLRLPLRFDIERLREALAEVQRIAEYQGEGFQPIALTRRPGDAASTSGRNDLSGLYWTRPDDSGRELRREGPVGEAGCSEFVPAYAHT